MFKNQTQYSLSYEEYSYVYLMTANGWIGMSMMDKKLLMLAGVSPQFYQ